MILFSHQETPLMNCGVSTAYLISSATNFLKIYLKLKRLCPSLFTYSLQFLNHEQLDQQSKPWVDKNKLNVLDLYKFQKLTQLTFTWSKLIIQTLKKV